MSPDSSSALIQPIEPVDVGPLKDEDTGLVATIVGLVVPLLLVVALVIAYGVLLWRRKNERYTELELKIIPKYTTGDRRQIRLFNPLQIGGFGEVWKGRYNNRVVAIKIPNKKAKRKLVKMNDMMKLGKMIEDEANAMHEMKHPRTVEFIFFEIESLAIVLEYMPMGSLQSLIEDSKNEISWSLRYQMMLDICEGMNFLHSDVAEDGSPKAILFHQDLKSGNVLLSQENGVTRAKISDFGLSGRSRARLTFSDTKRHATERDGRVCHGLDQRRHSVLSSA